MIPVLGYPGRHMPSQCERCSSMSRSLLQHLAVMYHEGESEKVK